ncbi:MAG: hypothetical protein R2856_12460 [Caldilineaceae bacterium]
MAVVRAGILGSLLASLSAAVGAEVIVLATAVRAEHCTRTGRKAHSAAESEAQQCSGKGGQLTDGKMCDVVFEVMGRQEPLLIATEVTKAGGQLILAATHEGGLRQVNLALWSERSLDIVNARTRTIPNSCAKDYAWPNEAGRGQLNPGPVCSHIYDLAEVGEALDTTKQRPDGFLKAMIIMQPGRKRLRIGRLMLLPPIPQSPNRPIPKSLYLRR